MEAAKASEFPFLMEKKKGRKRGEREDNLFVQLSDKNAEQTIKLFLFENQSFGFAQ